MRSLKHRAEKFVAADTNNDVVQPDLFPDDKLGQIDIVKTALVKAHQKHQTKLIVNHPGRNPLPDTLRREVIALMPEESALQRNFKHKLFVCRFT